MATTQATHSHSFAIAHADRGQLRQERGGGGRDDGRGNADRDTATERAQPELRVDEAQLAQNVVVVCLKSREGCERLDEQEDCEHGHSNAASPGSRNA